MKNYLLRLLPLCLGLCLTGCSTVYYNTLEKFGYEKREILVDRVDDARDSQQEAKEEFRDALEAFMSVVEVDATELERAYRRLDSDYTRLNRRAEEVKTRIDKVEEVSRALFAEWERELEKYQRDDLRRSSEQTLRETRHRAEDLIRTMRRAESRMYPVLDAFQDQVLFLKHNLNARAIASLQAEATRVQGEVDVLVQEMERAIDEAERFIEEMQL
ncbi:MAG: DUF2959 domain-containing protein [Verrucomicrobiota bacterium JB022]|nr:DUF2959 domain-containing protein [Verrucomicrobiota bacterium JB022]